MQLSCFLTDFVVFECLVKHPFECLIQLLNRDVQPNMVWISVFFCLESDINFITFSLKQGYLYMALCLNRVSIYLTIIARKRACYHLILGRRGGRPSG